MQGYRPQHYHNSPSLYTPKDTSSHFSVSYLQPSPSLKSSTKYAKEVMLVDRPKTNKSTRPQEKALTSQRQLDVNNSSMQRLLMDRSSNSFYGTFYNSSTKVRERGDKPGFASMFKLRDPAKDSSRETHNLSQRDSPMKRTVKYPPSHRAAEEKSPVYDISPSKSHRRNDSGLKFNDSARPTSRQTNNNSMIERDQSATKSMISYAPTNQKQVGGPSPAKFRSTKGFSISESPFTNNQDKERQLYKVVEVEQEKNPQLSNSQYERNTPYTAKPQEIIFKPFDFTPLEIGKACQSAYRAQEVDSAKVEQTPDKTTARKVSKRGFSIDQGNPHVIEKQTARIEFMRKSQKEDQSDLSVSVSNISSTMKKSMVKDASEREQKQQQQQQLKELQKQQEAQQQQLLKQQLQIQLQHQFQQQQQEKERQQQQLQQQQEKQQQEIVMIENEQDQIKYFEKLLNVDKMTFDFEKEMLKRRSAKQAAQAQAQAQAQYQQQQNNSSVTMTTKNSIHNRTRSMEDPASLIQTKSSLRFTTKRSEVEAPDFSSTVERSEYVKKY